MSTTSRIVACPQCKKSVAFDASNKWRPFCSERCRLIDLGAWASESHRIAGEPVDDNVQDNSEKDR